MCFFYRYIVWTIKNLIFRHERFLFKIPVVDHSTDGTSRQDLFLFSYYSLSVKTISSQPWIFFFWIKVITNPCPFNFGITLWFTTVSIPQWPKTYLPTTLLFKPWTCWWKLFLNCHHWFQFVCVWDTGSLLMRYNISVVTYHESSRSSVHFYKISLYWNMTRVWLLFNVQLVLFLSI